MAIAAIEWAFEQCLPNPSCKLVLLALADHADKHGLCWPSIARIEQRTSLSRSSVIRALAQLEKLRLIVRTRRGPTSNSYLLPSVTMTSKSAQIELSPGVTMTPKPSSEPSMKPKKAERSKLTAMTEHWCADEGLLSWAAEHHPLLTLEDLAHETDRFRDHWISKAERRADWRASWRNWIRNAARFAARSRPISRIEGVRRTNAQRINEAMARHGVLQDDRPADRPRLQLVAGSDLDAG